LNGAQGWAYIGLDNVIVTASGSAVPEPEAWVLMLAGLSGLGAALRSRRRMPTTSIRPT